MPKCIEAAIIKIIRDFVWEGGKCPPISYDRLCRPRSKGGIALLDVKTRNQAIEITWLRTYLDLSTHHPTWAFVTDALINTLKPEGLRDTNNVNSFLLTWSPPTCGPRTTPLPRDVTSLLKTAKDFNLCFAPPKLLRALKSQLPAWLHLGAPPRTYNKIKDKCLQVTHKAKSIKDLLDISARASDTSAPPPTMTGVTAHASPVGTIERRDALSQTNAPEQPKTSSRASRLDITPRR
ncbi:hypothetical protein BV22DRAFT_1023917 [Leucogyrophana mollusca]|uniref:Uncharacterized protein n=1 Tax=Leucogyrophana mollusca TaxID=85980 RepID=A0ACB8B1Y5_9AGAM|nr:hypothetical protein BV22DRAFT_1023917 [Leucogyrophana mollusca]